jgi:hypothetical protein
MCIRDRARATQRNPLSKNQKKKKKELVSNNSKLSVRSRF